MNRLGYLMTIVVLVAFGCGEAPKQDTPAATKPDTSPRTPSAAQSKALEQKAQLAASQTPGKADSDNDGVPDDLDQCTDTRAGVAVKADGCIKDQDQDGVADNQDACAWQPAWSTG